VLREKRVVKPVQSHVWACACGKAEEVTWEREERGKREKERERHKGTREKRVESTRKVELSERHSQWNVLALLVLVMVLDWSMQIWFLQVVPIVFIWPRLGMWQFPGPGLTLQHSCNQSYRNDDAGSLTNWASRELCPYEFCNEHFFFFFFFFCFVGPHSWYTDGGFQARGWIGATAASLRHSHSNARSEPRLWPTLLLTATLDP